MSYRNNKKAAIYNNADPTVTDQSGANHSDINIIVGQQLITGYAPGAPKPPMYEDWTAFPTDLREALEASRALSKIRQGLPAQLQHKPIEELLRLTPNELKHILTPAPTPEEKEMLDANTRNQGQADRLVRSTIHGAHDEKRDGGDLDRTSTRRKD